jgi:hypothetical protein
MERGFATGYHNPRKSDVKAGAESLPLARGVIASNPKPARVVQVAKPIQPTPIEVYWHGG